MTESKQERRDRRFARVRTPGTVAADLEEAEKLLALIRERYIHAYDIAYSAGGGGEAGESRGDLKFVNPTAEAAANHGKQLTREHLKRSGAMVAAALRGLRYAHGALIRAVPGSDPYEPVTPPIDRDYVATRAERAAAAEKQRERARRAEL